MKAAEEMIWAAAKAIYLEMHNVLHDRDQMWEQEKKFKGGAWYDAARAALLAAEDYRDVAISKETVAVTEGASAEIIRGGGAR